MRHSFLISTLLACSLSLCGCGSGLKLSGGKSSLDHARQLYEKNIESVADSSHKTADATQASADALVSIAGKLDQVIENTSPRRSLAAGSAAESWAVDSLDALTPGESALPFPVATPAEESAPAPSSVAVPDFIESLVSTPAPETAALVRSDADALSTIADRLDQIVNRLDAPRAADHSTGNGITTPDGLSVGVKEYIADHATGRYSFQGDPAISHQPSAVSQPPAMQCVNGQCVRTPTYSTPTYRFRRSR